MPGTRGEKRAHPYSDFNHNKNHKGADFTEGEKFQKCTEFIIEEASKEHCINRTDSRSGKSCTCSCLHDLEGKDASIDAIARYMVYFYNKKREERYETIMGWYRYGRIAMDDESSFSTATVFFIPFLHEANPDGDIDGADDEIAFLSEQKNCANAIGNLLDWGRIKWTEVKNHVLHNTFPQIHGNRGKEKVNTAFNQEVKNDLHAFFDYLLELAQPRATLFVREETGTGLRDDDEDVKELPTLFSKRGLYKRFCEERGWLVTASDKGKTELEEDANLEGERKPVCHWKTFYRFWELKYPKLKLMKAAKDVCVVLSSDRST